MNINDILSASPSDEENPHHENDKKVKKAVQHFFLTQQYIRRIWVFSAKRPIAQDRLLWALKDITDLTNEVMIHPEVRNPLDKVDERIAVYAYQLLGDIQDGPYTEMSTSSNPDELTALTFCIARKTGGSNTGVFINFYAINKKTNTARSIESNYFELDDQQRPFGKTFIQLSDLKNN